MDNDNQIRQRIQKLVIMSGLTKPKFAERIGFNKANFNLILTGKRKVPESLVFAIVSNKMATFEYIVDGTEEDDRTSKRFSDISNSGGGAVTINNGNSEKQSQRADAITNKMLDMLSKGIDNIMSMQLRLEKHDKTESSDMDAIRQRLDERNKLADRFLTMLDEKDRQLEAANEQIRRLTELLSHKEKGQE
ncbi:hypothetical protein C7120_09030 [Prevotella sp. oral taxon 376]|uniref:hypothetical protein n=1 Tax=Prevotella sp. oral taxon 376 TaxID=712466 RepID=UPI000D1E4A02|nr:hypothetical protein [Prevotella sp. oral taxon 376]PTL34633.1 hypothetical protein C7120_09030 [Prevotella sp. oral taxon 376]